MSNQLLWCSVKLLEATLGKHWESLRLQVYPVKSWLEFRHMVKRCEKVRTELEVGVVHNPSLLWNMSAGMTKIPQWHIDISSRMERTDSWDLRPNNGAVAHPEACYNGARRCRRCLAVLATRQPKASPGIPTYSEMGMTLGYKEVMTPISQQKLWCINVSTLDLTNNPPTVPQPRMLARGKSRFWSVTPVADFQISYHLSLCDEKSGFSSQVSPPDPTSIDSK